MHRAATSCAAASCHGGGQVGKVGSEHSTWAPEAFPEGASDPPQCGQVAGKDAGPAAEAGAGLARAGKPWRVNSVLISFEKSASLASQMWLR